MSLTGAAGEPTVVGSPAARLLMLWGRKPGPPDDVNRLQRLPSGY
nr:hypothetical protein [Actinoallomurus iriomotensis]